MIVEICDNFPQDNIHVTENKYEGRTLFYIISTPKEPCPYKLTGKMDNGKVDNKMRHTLVVLFTTIKFALAKDL